MEKKEDKKKKLWLIIAQYWIPSIITVALGFLTGVYMTREGYLSAEKQLYLKQRVTQGEAVAIHFDEYIENWRRLIQISEYEKQEGHLDMNGVSRKNSYVNARSNARDKLFGALSALELYFGPKVLQEVGEFRKWDDNQTGKRLGELPPLVEWRTHKAKIISAIRSELEGRK